MLCLPLRSVRHALDLPTSQAVRIQFKEAGHTAIGEEGHYRGEEGLGSFLPGRSQGTGQSRDLELERVGFNPGQVV